MSGENCARKWRNCAARTPESGFPHVLRLFHIRRGRRRGSRYNGFLLRRLGGERNFVNETATAPGSVKAELESSGRGWTTYWCVGALMVVMLFFAFVRARLRDVPLERDEGEFAYVGQLMLEG